MSLKAFYELAAFTLCNQEDVLEDWSGAVTFVTGRQAGKVGSVIQTVT